MVRPYADSSAIKKSRFFGLYGLSHNSGRRGGHCPAAKAFSLVAIVHRDSFALLPFSRFVIEQYLFPYL